MIDTNNTTNTSADDLATPEETMATLRRGRTSHPLATSSVHGDYEGGSFNMMEGGAVLSEGDADVIAAERANTGITRATINNTIAAVTQRATWIKDQLARQSFDRVGNAHQHVTGHLRQNFENELASLAEELDVSNRTLQSIAERDRQANTRQRMNVEADAIEFEFTQGNRERAEALRKAQLDVEAKLTAERVLKLRYGIG